MANDLEPRRTGGTLQAMDNALLVVVAVIGVLIVLKIVGFIAGNGTDVAGKVIGQLGLNGDAAKAVTDAVSVPVIASGGVGTLGHLVDGIVRGGADAVLAASIFHFEEHTIAEAKSLMAGAGVVVRPVAE